MHQDPASVMTRLHGMLEFDPIADNEEFSEVITALLDAAGIPVAVVANATGQSIETVYD